MFSLSLIIISTKFSPLYWREYPTLFQEKTRASEFEMLNFTPAASHSAMKQLDVWMKSSTGSIKRTTPIATNRNGTSNPCHTGGISYLGCVLTSLRSDQVEKWWFFLVCLPCMSHLFLIDLNFLIQHNILSSWHQFFFFPEHKQDKLIKLSQSLSKVGNFIFTSAPVFLTGCWYL